VTLLLGYAFVSVTHGHDPVHPKSLVLSRVDALPADARECLSLGTILEWLVQLDVVAVEVVAFVFHTVMDGWPIMYNELFSHNF